MIRVRPLKNEDTALFEAFLVRAGGVPGLLTETRAHPRVQPAYVLLALRGSDLVGCLLVRHRRLRIGVAQLECANLDYYPVDLPLDVVEALMEACFEALHNAEICLIRLNGTQQRYEPLGLAAYQPQAILTIGTFPRHPGTWRVASSTDCPDLMALYEVAYQKLALSELRTTADWSERLLAECRVLEDRAQRCVGYLRLNGMYVIEAAATDDGMARRLLAYSTEPQDSSIGYILPEAHPLIRVGLQLGGELRIRRPAPDQATWLIGVLDGTGLLLQLKPELERRLAASRYAGWTGAVWFEVSAGQFGLRIVDGTARELDEPVLDAIRIRQIALGGLAQLLLGYRTAADLRATNDLDCDDAALGVLDVLFAVL